MDQHFPSLWKRRGLFALAGVLTGLSYGLTLAILQPQKLDLKSFTTPEPQAITPEPIRADDSLENRLENRRDDIQATTQADLSDGCSVPPGGGPPVNANFEPC